MCLEEEKKGELGKRKKEIPKLMKKGTLKGEDILLEVFYEKTRLVERKTIRNFQKGLAPRRNKDARFEEGEKGLKDPRPENVRTPSGDRPPPAGGKRLKPTQG